MSASDSSVISVEENSSQLIGDGDGDESVCFAVGDKFYTYDELKKKIDAYERFRSVQLCHSDSRTLEAAKKRVPRKVSKAKKELMYYQINFSCILIWW